MSYPEYLAFEASALTKHEYLRGEVFAMAGGTPEHAALSASVIGSLIAELRGKPCRVFSSDLRVRVMATDLTTYPDASVICGQLETSPDDEHAATNPTLLVEILSDSSEAYDRGEKAAHYRRIPSLQEYLLVSQKDQRLELFRRSGSSHWELYEAASGEALELTSIGVSLQVDEIYRDPLAVEG